MSLYYMFPRNKVLFILFFVPFYLESIKRSSRNLLANTPSIKILSQSGILVIFAQHAENVNEDNNVVLKEMTTAGRCNNKPAW
jgi:hypothetical protein